MFDALKIRHKDVLQRVALVIILFVIALGGTALGVGGWPDLLGLSVAVLGACTLLWVLDPAFQYLYDTQEDEEIEEVKDRGDVA